MKSLVAKDILNTDVIPVPEDMTVHELAALDGFQALSFPIVFQGHYLYVYYNR